MIYGQSLLTAHSLVLFLRTASSVQVLLSRLVQDILIHYLVSNGLLCNPFIDISLTRNYIHIKNKTLNIRHNDHNSTAFLPTEMTYLQSSLSYKRSHTEKVNQF